MKIETVLLFRYKIKKAAKLLIIPNGPSFLRTPVTLDILSRLPARTATCCKLVGKSWLDLLKTPEFVKSHISKSVPCLAIFRVPPDANLFRLVPNLKPCKLIEFVNDISDEFCRDVI